MPSPAGSSGSPVISASAEPTLRLAYRLYRTDQTFWVSSSSWLPVRWVTRESGVDTTTINYRYLRPTRARMALLRPRRALDSDAGRCCRSGPAGGLLPRLAY
jgi:hypothetical protein